MICQYGCGREAKHLIKYKSIPDKWCCEESYHKCVNQLSKRPLLEKIPLKERFDSSYEIVLCKNNESLADYHDENCWEWTKYKDKDGYGTISNENNYPSQAHRISYELYIGRIPDGYLVCHICDNPSCVNPNHLFVGTHLDNNRDRKNKKRSATGNRNGMYTKPETRFYNNQVASHKWRIVHKNGKINEIINLTKFCRENNLCYQTLLRKSKNGQFYKNIKCEKIEEFIYKRI